MSKEMSATEQMKIVREIVSWGSVMSEYDRLYAIQAFLLGWWSAEQVHNITASQYR